MEADPAQFGAALLNLAINARDAMPSGGRPTPMAHSVTLVRAAGEVGEDAPAGDYVAITVADNGLGMTGEVRRTAFDPFFMTKPIGQGSRPGLSQVYGFIKQSRGHVTLRSAPGRAGR